MLKVHKYPKTCTSAAKEYFLADIQATNFVKWVTFMAGRLDYVLSIAKEALAESSDVAQDHSSPDHVPVDTEKGMVNELKRNRLLLLHMIHARMTDNYLVYLSSILREAFRCRPEILRSSEKIEYAEVLRFQTIEDLITHLAEKKVHDLSYKSVVDLEVFFQDHLGTPLVPAEQRDQLVTAVATRNIIVHNRGVRNKIYCSNVGEDPSMIGKVRDIGIGSVEKINLLFFQSVKNVDSTLRKKLKITGVRVDIQKEFNQREA